MEILKDCNIDSNENLSDSDKIKKKYDDLCKNISKLDNCSYIDDDGYRVTLKNGTPDGSGEYSKYTKRGIIVVKEDMKTGNCYITNIFYEPKYKNSFSRKVIKHEWGMVSWIQKSNGGSSVGFSFGGGGGVVGLSYDGEIAGFEKLNNLDIENISKILDKIDVRYKMIKQQSQQKPKKMEIMLDRVENNTKENDADKFLDQALENMS